MNLYERVKKLICERFYITKLNESIFAECYGDGIWVYENANELYKNYNIGSCYKFYELEETIDSILKIKPDSNFNTIGDQLVNNMIEDCYNYDFEHIVTDGEIYVAIEFGIINELKTDFFDKFDINGMISDLQDMLDIEVSEDKLKSELLAGNIKIYNSKREFINEFNIKAKDLLDFILTYDSKNDDFVEEVEDVALIYLEQQKFIPEKYCLHKLNDFEFIYIFDVNNIISKNYNE